MKISLNINKIACLLMGILVIIILIFTEVFLNHPWSYLLGWVLVCSLLILEAWKPPWFLRQKGKIILWCYLPWEVNYQEWFYQQKKLLLGTGLTTLSLLAIIHLRNESFLSSTENLWIFLGGAVVLFGICYLGLRFVIYLVKFTMNVFECVSSGRPRSKNIHF